MNRYDKVQHKGRPACEFMRLTGGLENPIASAIHVPATVFDATCGNSPIHFEYRLPGHDRLFTRATVWCRAWQWPGVLPRIASNHYIVRSNGPGCCNDQRQETVVTMRSSVKATQQDAIDYE